MSIQFLLQCCSKIHYKTMYTDCCMILEKYPFIRYIEVRKRYIKDWEYSTEIYKELQVFN